MPESVNEEQLLAPPPPPKQTLTSWAEALGILRARSTDLRIAYDEVRRADGQVRAALGAALPNIFAQGSYTREFVSSTSEQVIGLTGPVTNLQPVFGPYTAPQPNVVFGSVQLTQPILNVEVWHAIGTAKAGVEASELAFSDTKRKIAFQAASAIVGVVTAERVATLNRTGLRQSLERLQIALRRKQIGGSTLLDAVRARRDAEIAKAAVLAADESMFRAREALGLALGVGGQLGVAPELGIEDIERSCNPLASVDDRTDVVAQKKKVDVAQRNIGDIYLQFLPTLSGIGALSWTNLDQGPVPATAFSLEALVSVPIWDGGTRYGMLRQMRALRDEAEHTLEELRRQAGIEVDQTRRGVELAQHQREVAAAGRTMAAETEQLTRMAFETGQGTSLDLVIAAEQLREADVTLAMQDYSLVRARIASVVASSRCPWL